MASFERLALPGLGENGNAHLKLIPDKMVTYAFADNYKHDKTVLLGVIEWVPNGKVEHQHVFKCE